MYDELLKQLRECTEEMNGEKTLWHQAADAIEELQVTVDGLTAQTSMVFEKTEGRTVIKFEPKWIPVTERLPERNYNCLVADDGTIVYGYMNFTGEWMDCLGDKLKYVSHWMPLPQPPKDGEP